jgi:hypothetical protein
MERTEFVLTPVLLEANSFAELAAKVVAIRMNQPSTRVFYLSDKSAIAELYQSYEPTLKGEGKTNG